jgi:hypothetical protein
MATVTAPRGGKRPARGEPAHWQGPTREYDLLKEFVAALVAMAVLAVVLAAVFSSPDEKTITLQGWAQASPNDFVATATSELAGTSTSAGYGAPYNKASEGQAIGPLKLQKWGGVRIPVDPAQDFVVGPLSTQQDVPALTTALAQWSQASDDQRTTWASSYADALAAAPDGDPAGVAAGDYGPVPAMTAALLGMANSGVLDSDLVNTGGGFFQTDYTRPLLFLGDSTYLSETAADRHLEGEQWGMMNETGDYPGQAWLWLYTFWYQIKPFSTSDNADALVWGLVMVLSLVLVLLPFIPGLRSIPSKIPVYRLIWRDYYRRYPKN